jgi:PIN domain nuclease of toxin-antitoxin system
MFVTDTHAIAYYAGRRLSKLGPRSRRVFHEAEQGKVVVYVPTPVLWEIADLAKVGVVELPSRFDHWCREIDARAGFIIEPLTWPDVDQAGHLPFRDPFDCLIAGTAIRLGCPLVTKDQSIVDSRLVETIW